VLVNWKQWEEIIVPILEDERWPNWMGSTGGACSSMGLPTIKLGAGLYDGRVEDLIVLLGEDLNRRGVEAGYGDPNA